MEMDEEEVEDGCEMPEAWELEADGVPDNVEDCPCGMLDDGKY